MTYALAQRGLSERALSSHGFTLIELLTALLILSLLALMSYRGLGAVLDARAYLSQEAATWRGLSAFCARFEQDVRLAAPNPARSASGTAAAWIGRLAAAPGPRLEFSRFAATEDADRPRRVGYGLNERQEIELWLWPGIDDATDAMPARYAVLSGVAALDVEYLNADLAWVGAWPAPPRDVAIPRAVRLRVVLASGIEIVRVFALNS